MVFALCSTSEVKKISSLHFLNINVYVPLRLPEICWIFLSEPQISVKSLISASLHMSPSIFANYKHWQDTLLSVLMVYMWHKHYDFMVFARTKCCHLLSICAHAQAVHIRFWSNPFSTLHHKFDPAESKLPKPPWEVIVAKPVLSIVWTGTANQNWFKFDSKALKWTQAL